MLVMPSAADEPRETIRDDRREERHERDRHRHAVPDERPSRWLKVVVRGTERDERHARAENDVVGAQLSRGQARQSYEAQHADHEKRQVREHVPGIGDARHIARVGEGMIRRILRNRIEPERAGYRRDRDRQYPEMAPIRLRQGTSLRAGVT